MEAKEIDKRKTRNHAQENLGEVNASPNQPTHNKVQDELDTKGFLSISQRKKFISKAITELDKLYLKPDSGIILKKNKNKNNTMNSLISGSVFNVSEDFFVSLHQGVIINDLEGNIISCNDEARRILACSHKDCCVLGMPCKKNIKQFYTSESDKKIVATELKQAEEKIKFGIVRDHSLFIYNCSGTPLPVKVSLYNYYDEENNRLGTINLFIKDIKEETRNLKLIMDLGCELLEIENSTLWVVDDEKKSLADCEAHVMLHIGTFDPNYLTETIKVDPGIIKRFLDSEYPLTIKNLREKKWHGKYRLYKYAIRHGDASMMSVPISIYGEIKAVWNLYHRQDLRHFSKRERDLADVLGKQMALVMSADSSNNTAILYRVVSLYKELRETRESYGRELNAVRAETQREKRMQKDSEKSPYYDSFFGWSKETIFEDADHALIKRITSLIKKDLKEIVDSTKCESASIFLLNSARVFLFNRIAEMNGPLFSCGFQGEAKDSKESKVNSDLTHSLFDLISDSTMKFVDVNTRLLEKAQMKIANIVISKEIKIFLENEGIKYFGDLAMFTKQNLYESFNTSPYSSKYIETILRDLDTLLKQHGLKFGINFRTKKPKNAYVRINRGILENPLTRGPWFKDISHTLVSGRLMHFLVVPIFDFDERIVGYFRVLNKTAGQNTCPELAQTTPSGFTEEDIDILQKKAETWSQIISANRAK